MYRPDGCEAQVPEKCPVHGPAVRLDLALKAVQKDPKDQTALDAYYEARTELADQERQGFLKEGEPTPEAKPKPHYLSVRKIQPGDVQTFRESEIRFTNDFVSSLQEVLGKPVSATIAVKGKKPGVRAGRMIEITDTKGKPLYTVEEHPSDLRDIYGRNTVTNRPQGLLPELKITDAKTKRFMYFEVKEQGVQGNAHERGYKLFTAKFTKVLKERTKLPYHAYTIVMYKSLSKERRYLTEFQHQLEPNQYILGEDEKDLHEKMTNILGMLGKRPIVKPSAS